ncbi:MAG: penicillin acylase family protein [Bacteroidota bacterium]
MKWIRVILTLGLTGLLVWFCHHRQVISGTPVPPLGKFFNPQAGFWQNAEAPDTPPISPNLELAVQNPVSVVFDSLLVPHIFADNNYDLYFAQGYTTAKYRLWQMEFQTHFAAGRISELVGSAALSLDRTNRRLGYVEAANHALMGIESNAEVQGSVDAYADGINAYINSLAYKDLPFEYKLLGYEPETWSTLKTGLLLIYMGSNLTSRDYDLQNTNMLKLLGMERFNFLFPDYPQGIDPVISPDHDWSFDPSPVAIPDTPYYEAYTPDLIEMSDPANGSNNWAVSGSKAHNGTPILANDPHLGLNLPSLWYMIQLHGPGVNVKGVSLPGAPGIIIGFNDSVAWGVTNGAQDVRDWYAITFRDETKKEYLYNGEWLKTQFRVENIQVRGSEPFLDTICITHHGPVVYDSGFPSTQEEKRGYALRWTLHQPKEEMRAFYELNRADNYADYEAALPRYGIPSQNFVFASSAGDIAMWQQGDIPLRFPRQGQFLMDGTTPDTQWQGIIPAEQNPRQLNPEREFVSSANQIATDESYPYYIIDNGFEDYRNRRINSRLNEMDSIRVEDMQALQMDNYGLKAAENLPFMLDTLDEGSLSSAEQAVYDLLSLWNYMYELDEQGAVAFELWWDTLYSMVWDEFAAKDLAMRWPDHYRTSQLLKEHPEDTVFDIRSTPSREYAVDVIRKSFSAASNLFAEVKAENKDTWGPYKTTQLTHLSRQTALSVQGLPTNGYRQIVNATSQGHGPSWRMVVEVGDQPNAFGVYPGGQSGNPGSLFYTNFVETWRSGQYYSLPLMIRPDSTATTLMVQQITPKD